MNIACRGLGIFSLIFAAAGCIGVSESRRDTAAAGGGAATAAQAAAGPKRCRTDPKPAPEGVLDDFEDGNNQLTLLEGRDGYWWSAHDEHGSTITFKVEEKGAGGSEQALHATGKNVPSAGDDYWGAQVGVNFLSQTGGLYDAAKYAGISFKARVGANSTHEVRFKIGDVNTHKDGNVCTTCWNLFGKTITLGPEWKEYRIPFSSTEQEPGWGAPRPPSVTPGKLIAINWTIGPGQTFDIWLDDVGFMTCE